jgi:uncharacterized protein YkwD
MRKSLGTIIFILLALAAFWYWPKIEFWLAKGPQLLQVAQTNSTLENLKQQVLTGGALRGTENAPDAYLTRAGTINFTNQARQNNGNLPALTENQKLDQDAQNKLKDMFARQYFEHVSPDGKGPADQAATVGYQYVIIGENLALGNFKNDAALVEAWMNSPGHRANILNVKYQEIGVAVGKGAFEGKTVWLAVQEFGKPLSSCPAIDQNLKNQIVSLKGDVDSITPQLQDLKNQIDGTPEPKTHAEVDAYNQLVARYNALVKIFNNKVDALKQATDAYNAQVQQFNLCAS